MGSQGAGNSPLNIPYVLAHQPPTSSTKIKMSLTGWLGPCAVNDLNEQRLRACLL
jgi:hypothetical protein